MLRRQGPGPVKDPKILDIGIANPLVGKLTQEQSFHASGYQGERIRKILLNSDIDHRNLCLESTLTLQETVSVPPLLTWYPGRHRCRAVDIV